MKKLLSSVLLIAVLTAGLFGADAEKNITLGVKAGPIAGFITGEGWNAMVELLGGKDGVLISAAGGFFTSVDFHPNIAVESGLTIVHTGGKFSGSILGYGYTYSLTATGLEIPILFKPKLSLGPGDIYLTLGPDIMMYITNIVEKIDYDDPTILDDYYISRADNALLFGFSAGAGYSFPAGPGVFSFDIRYTRMLTQTYEASVMFPNIIGMYVGYGFLF